MKVEYKFVNAALVDTNLQHDLLYEHPTIHSVLLTEDQYQNDVLTITVIVPTESV